MTRTIGEIIEDFNSFTVEDFNLWNEDSDGNERLYALIQELYDTPNRELAIDAMFNMLERFPDPDAHQSLGSPGPLVHMLEKLNYQVKLIESVRRKPSTYTVWMINRTLNTELSKEQRAFWLELVHEVLMHPLASEGTKNDARNFIEHQSNKRRDYKVRK